MRASNSFQQRIRRAQRLDWMYRRPSRWKDSLLFAAFFGIITTLVPTILHWGEVRIALVIGATALVFVSALWIDRTFRN